MRRAFANGVGAAILLALVPAGCLEGGEAGEGDVAATVAALDNQVGVADGTACYQDVPMRKGKMEMNMCCFDDPIKGTSECVACDKDHHCTPGGAEPGALTAGTGTVFGGIGGVLDPGFTTSTGGATLHVAPVLLRSTSFR